MAWSNNWRHSRNHVNIDGSAEDAEAPIVTRIGSGEVAMIGVPASAGVGNQAPAIYIASDVGKFLWNMALDIDGAGGTDARIDAFWAVNFGMPAEDMINRSLLSTQLLSNWPGYWKPFINQSGGTGNHSLLTVRAI